MSQQIHCIDTRVEVDYFCQQVQTVDQNRSVNFFLFLGNKADNRNNIGTGRGDISWLNMNVFDLEITPCF